MKLTASPIFMLATGLSLNLTVPTVHGQAPYGYVPYGAYPAYPTSAATPAPQAPAPVTPTYAYSQPQAQSYGQSARSAVSSGLSQLAFLDAKGGPSGSRPGVSIGLGASLFSFSDIETKTSVVKYDMGSGFILPVGFHFGNGFSLEISGGKFSSSIDSIVGKKKGLITGTETTMVPIMASGVISLPATQNLSFYIGGGGGLVYTETDLDSLDDIDISLDDGAYDIGLQALMGLKFHMNQNFSLDLGYRYQNVFREEEDISGHSFEAGFTFRF